MPPAWLMLQGPLLVCDVALAAAVDAVEAAPEIVICCNENYGDWPH